AVDVDLVDPGRLAAVLRAPGLGYRFHLIHVGRRVLKELFGRPETGSEIRDVRVVVGDALRPPQQWRVLLPVIVVWPHLAWTNSLHVPEMEELMRQQRIHEVAEVAGRIGEGLRRHDVVL